MRAGWFRDSYRHSLAARGITTKRFYSTKRYHMPKWFERVGNMANAGIVSSAEDEKRFVQERREQLRQDALQRLYAAERRGELTPEQVDNFNYTLSGELAAYDRGVAANNVRGSLMQKVDDYIKMHKPGSVMPWREEDSS